MTNYKHTPTYFLNADPVALNLQLGTIMRSTYLLNSILSSDYFTF